MSSTYAGNNVFPANITEPSDGEPPVVASVNVPLEGLADRTIWLKTRTDAADGAPFRNLRVPVFAEINTTVFDFAFTRADGSSPAFWSSQFQLWIKPGKDTVGKFYVGDNGFYTLFDTGLTAVKVSFGCGNDTRTCVFDSTLRTLGGGVDLKYMQGPTGLVYTGAWTDKTLEVIGGFLSYVRAGDAILAGSSRLIVCGGGDVSGTGQFLIWKSDDGGTTFTRVTVGNVSASQDYLTRVIIGKSGRLVAWIKTSSANQGNKLFYSDDNGDTWSSRSAIGFDQITDGAYLSDLDLWAFGTTASNNIYTTPDPVLGAFTAHATVFPVTTLGGFGHYLLFGATIASGWQQMYLSVDGMTSVQAVGRDTALGAGYKSISVSALGHMCIASTTGLTLSEKI
jgi:hypothetical protein